MRNKDFKPGPQALALKNYFESNHIKKVDVAEQIGISSGALSNILAGRDSLGKVRARRLADIYGFDYVFLLTGEGSLFPAEDPGKASASGSSVCPSVSELLQRISDLEAAAKAKDAELAKKDEEVSWLRSLINRLLGQNSTENLQITGKAQGADL